MLTRTEKSNILKSIVWDYHVQEDKLLDVLLGIREKEGTFDQTKIFIRALERLPWHDILEIIGKERIKSLLTPDLISNLRIPEQQQRYDRIRKILHGEPISFSRWNPIHRETYKNSLLSNRWYRFK